MWAHAVIQANTSSLLFMDYNMAECFFFFFLARLPFPHSSIYELLHNLF